MPSRQMTCLAKVDVGDYANSQTLAHLLADKLGAKYPAIHFLVTDELEPEVEVACEENIDERTKDVFCAFCEGFVCGVELALGLA